MESEKRQEANDHGVELREQLVHSIYALVENPDEWPNTLDMLNALIRQPDKVQGDAEFMSMLPHISRASLLLGEIDKLKLSQHQSQQIIDSVPIAIMLIQSDARIDSANQRALNLLKQMDVRTDQHLHFNTAEYQTAFSDAIRKVASGHSQNEPLRLGNLNLWICSHGHEHEQIALFLSDHTSQHRISTDSLQQVYGLTAQEANVTSALCNGRTSLDIVIEDLGISMNTARSHLKKVFAKIGARNQAELMKIVLLNPSLTMQRENGSSHSLDNRPYQLTRLPSGRTMSWAEYGDPAGKPTLFCHPITGSRLMVAELTDNLAHHGIRLIVPDRAGYGFSSLTERDVMEQWLEDAGLFFNSIGIEACEVIGHSVGGSYAMALAARYPKKVTRLHLVGSIAPFDEKDDSKMMLPMNRVLFYLARSNQAAARALLNFAIRNVTKKPDSYFKLIMKSLPETDRHTLETNELRQRLIVDFAETHRQGISHLAEEMLYLFNHWHIEAGQITCPTIIWHGLADRHSPAFLMQRFGQSLPNCIGSHWLPELGFYMLFSHWDAVIARVGQD